MRKAKVYNFGKYAGDLIEIEKFKNYKFIYKDDYEDAPVSLTIVVSKKEYEFNSFPPFFEGLLPEGIQLEALLRQTKTDKNDLFGQLILVGRDLVGSITVEEAE
ncbi:MAG: HipA N-terminal domain-containing protein [Bacteroidetes bacterium]|nr:HipA N-terminal domain-containing protein [Bacteroidota bacterium]